VKQISKEVFSRWLQDVNMSYEQLCNLADGVEPVEAYVVMDEAWIDRAYFNNIFKAREYKDRMYQKGTILLLREVRVEE